MRGLISLAVIFFVALSAQASDTTSIQCEYTNPIHGDGIYTITFGADSNNKITYLSTDIIGCLEKHPNTGTYGWLNSGKILINCRMFGYHQFEITIDRITGKFFLDRLQRGTCRKAKQKF